MRWGERGRLATCRRSWCTASHSSASRNRTSACKARQGACSCRWDRTNTHCRRTHRVSAVPAASQASAFDGASPCPPAPAACCTASPIGRPSIAISSAGWRPRLRIPTGASAAVGNGRRASQRPRCAATSSALFSAAANRQVQARSGGAICRRSGFPTGYS